MKPYWVTGLARPACIWADSEALALEAYRVFHGNAASCAAILPYETKEREEVNE